MENVTLKKRTVFISYCHMDISDEWIDKFASALGNFGIECIADIYDLQLGQDLSYFMEQIKRVDKVIMLLGETYMIKANERKGGVGTETQIISNDVYNNVEQTKFIPVVIGKDENGNAYIPFYLESRLYTDFSDDNLFAQNINGLIRQIHKLPKRTKPVVLEPPKTLLEGNSTIANTDFTSETNFSDLSRLILSEMEIYKCTAKELEKENDECIINKISQSKELRDSYVRNIYLLVKSNTISVEEIICFFEKCYKISGETKGGDYYSCQNDACKFFLQEIIIYTIAILYKERKYIEIKQLIKTTYFPESNEQWLKQGIRLEQFYCTLESFEERNYRLNLHRNVHSDMLMERAYVTDMDINFSDVQLADVLIFILSEWFYRKKGDYCYWYPKSAKYTRYDDYINLKKYLISKSRFLLIKELFDVDSQSSFIRRYDELEAIVKDDNMRAVPSVCSIIKREELFSKD